MSEWDKVIEDTTAAISMDDEYVKAINRRATAYEHQKKYSEALLDFTASCIIDNFKSDSTAQAVERLLKAFAEEKAKEMMASRPPKLPSPIFVGNYLQSFRPKARPSGLEDSVELDENTGKGQLQLGLQGLEKRTGDGYEEARKAFSKALELGELGEHEALAYNMRGTMRTLLGDHAAATEDFDKSIELDPGMTQSYIKRASISLELGEPAKADEEFAKALEQNPEDPDVYYHRAQAHFIKGDLSDAQKDYQKSIEIDKDFIFSHIQLGVTQYKMGSIASSMATFRRCIKNFPKVPDVYNYYGELLLDQGSFSEAIEKFDTAMEMEKQSKPMAMNVLPLINKALALFQWKQDFKEAEKLCQKALISKFTCCDHETCIVLTCPQSTPSVISPLPRWLSSSSSRTTCLVLSSTSSVRPSSLAQKARSSTPSPTPRLPGLRSRSRRSTPSLPPSLQAAPADPHRACEWDRNRLHP